MDKKTLMESNIGKALIALVVSYAVIFLVSLWMEALSSLLFLKVSVTFAVVMIVLVAVYLIRREFETDRKMQDEKYMD